MFSWLRTKLLDVLREELDSVFYSGVSLLGSRVLSE